MGIYLDCCPSFMPLTGARIFRVPNHAHALVARFDKGQSLKRTERDNPYYSYVDTTGIYLDCCPNFTVEKAILKKAVTTLGDTKGRKCFPKAFFELLSTYPQPLNPLL